MSTSIAVTMFAAILIALAVDHYGWDNRGAITLARAGLDLLHWLAVWR